MDQKEKVVALVRLCEDDILVLDDGDYDAYHKGKGIIRCAEVLGVITKEERFKLEGRLLASLEKKYGGIV